MTNNNSRSLRGLLGGIIHWFISQFNVPENRRLNLLFLASGISGFGTWFSLNGIVAYFKVTQGVTDATVGWIYFWPFAVTAALGIPLGAWAGRLEAKKASVIANWVSTAFTASYLLVWAQMGEVKTFWPIVSMVAVGRISQLVIEPEFGRLFGVLAEKKGVKTLRGTRLSGKDARKLYKKRRDAASATGSAVLQLSTIAGVTAGPIIASYAGTSVVFIVDCATYAVAALLLSTIAVRVYPGANDSHDNPSVGATWQYMGKMGLASLTLIAIGPFLLWGAKDTLAPALTQAAGFDVANFGWFSGLSTLAELLVTLAATLGVISIAARFVRLYVFAFTLTPIMMAAAAWSQLGLLLLPVKFLEGIFGNLTGSSLYNSVVNDAADQYKGTVSGIFSAVTRGFQAIAMVAVGYASTRFGPANTMFGVGLLMLALLAIGSVRRKSVVPSKPNLPMFVLRAKLAVYADGLELARFALLCADENDS